MTTKLTGKNTISKLLLKKKYTQNHVLTIVHYIIEIRYRTH